MVTMREICLNKYAFTVPAHLIHSQASKSYKQLRESANNASGCSQTKQQFQYKLIQLNSDNNIIGEGKKRITANKYSNSTPDTLLTSKINTANYWEQTSLTSLEVCLRLRKRYEILSWKFDR